MGLWEALVIAASAFAAGLINSVAGGGTLLSFPALIWVGRDPVLANATSTVALWPGSLAGVYGFRRELKGGRRWLLAFVAPSLLGGALGAALLLRTPSETFERLVPFLILFATLLIALHEPLSRRLRRGAADGGAREGDKDDKGDKDDSDDGVDRADGAEPTRAWWAGAILFQFGVGVYGGYFGAGIGILMIGALGLLGFTDIHRMNALKNLLAIFINGVAAVWFVFSGAVVWADVLLMTAAAVAGGLCGPRLAYRVGRRAARTAVVVIGLLMAVSFLFR